MFDLNNMVKSYIACEKGKTTLAMREEAYRTCRRFYLDNQYTILASGINDKDCGHDLYMARSRPQESFCHRTFAKPIRDQLARAAVIVNKHSHYHDIGGIMTV